ncbi:MAG: TenA family protein [Bacteroidales bacterium]
MELEKKFTESLWLGIRDIYENVFECDFIKELVQGTLSRDIFCNYLIQDDLYLKDDIKAFSKLAQRLNDKEKDEGEFFKKMCNDCIAIEQFMHDYYEKKYDIDLADKKIPVIEQYTNHIVTIAENEAIEVAQAALLPCYWVYNSMGKRIYNDYKKEKKNDNNPYKEWIETYNNDSYDTYTNKFIQIVEDSASIVDNKTRKKMYDAFYKSTVFELRFFKEIY